MKWVFKLEQFQKFEGFIYGFNTFLHEHSIAYVIWLYCIVILLMIADYFLGMMKAKYFEGNLSSLKGTQGMIKKMSTLILMVLMMLLIPMFKGAGVSMVTVVYVGIIINEMVSIDENYKVITGKEDSILSTFIEKAKELISLKKGV